LNRPRASKDHEDLGLTALKERLRPWRLHHYSTIDSTNLEARRLRGAGGLSAPAIVWATTQTAGRGRGGNQWVSPGGSLTATFVLPAEEGMEPHLVPLYAGLAVRSVVEAVLPVGGGDAVTLKWPNDVYIGGRKVSGILCERVGGTGPSGGGGAVDLIGIGVNVSCVPHDFSQVLVRSVATLAAEGAVSAPEAVLCALADELKGRLLRTRAPWPVAAAEFRRHCHLTGKRLRIVVSPEVEAITGVCGGIDDDGFLQVETALGAQRVVSGHVELAGGTGKA
jgi:BirA family transcriptional regulator, biotin operon repressor / biotin---[acetyl-CoA-carboxylase] ligase